MAKDAAINWYFDNWQGGTKGMNRLQKACYFDLLQLQFYIGHLSLEQIKNELCSDYHIWTTIKHKYEQDESGNYSNGRMDTEIEKRRKFSNQQSEKMKKRWNTNKNDTIVDTIVVPNNGIEIETLRIKEKSEKPLREKTALSDLQILQTVEFIDRIRQIKLSTDELKNYFEAFKIHSPKKDFQTENDYLQHFRNWLKMQKLEKKADEKTERKRFKF